MDQPSRHSVGAVIRPPIFFRITVGLFALLTLFGVAMALLLVRESKGINSAAG